MPNMFLHVKSLESEYIKNVSESDVAEFLELAKVIIL